MRPRRAALAAAAVAAALGALGDARAGLGDSTERLVRTWRGAGAQVVVDRTRFLNEDETTAVDVPALPDFACTTVVFLGARGIGFHVRIAEGGDEGTGKSVSSEAGAASIEWCGDPPPRRLLLSSDSGRGAVETIIARSTTPLSPLRVVLPERTGGALVPGPEPGALEPLSSPANRAEKAEGRARLDGGAVDARVTWRAGIDGAGTGHETLEPGCHRLHLLAVDPGLPHAAQGRKRVDLDAEMRDDAGDRLLARDRSDAPDAELAVCVGETTHVSVAFVGSPPNAPVLVAHFSWRLPNYLPTMWGPEAEARMAKVLFARHVRSLPRPPFVLAQGGPGATPLPLFVEPGGCYLAVVSLVQGKARAVALGVRVGGEDFFDDRGIDEVGATVAFCAGRHDRAAARVEIHGAPPLGWALAVYRIENDVWESWR